MSKQTIDTRFKAFHKAHPEVLAKLLELAREAKAAGRTKCGIRMLWETMRWTFYLKNTAATDYVFNDHYTSRYARLIEEQYAQEFAGFFELRALRSV